MKRSSFAPSGGQVTFLRRLLNLRHSLAFRLAVWYAGFFAVSLLAALLAFYEFQLHGSHGISRHALSELREAFRRYFGLPLGLIIIFSAAGGWLMARRALSGVEEVTRAAVDITGGALDRRVPVTGRGDEIDRLAGAFNEMVGRVQDLLGQMKEISENIAHDLRSPITRMRGMAEMDLTSGSANEDHNAMAGTIIEECDRLLGMINTMLDISEAESGLMKLAVGEVDLALLLRDVCDLFQPLAEDRNIEMAVEAPETLPVPGDLRRLQRLFSNLVDNAIKYTPRGGSIRLLTEKLPQGAIVRVRNTGTGIPEEDLPHIFDRFYRGEKSRSTPGHGLGLSLARAIVLVHGGRIEAESSPGRGAEFTVTLPG